MDYYCCSLFLQYIVTALQHEAEVAWSREFILYDKKVDNAFLIKIIHDFEDLRSFLGFFMNIANADRYWIYCRLCCMETTFSEHLYNMLARNTQDVLTIYSFAMEGLQYDALFAISQEERVIETPGRKKTLLNRDMSELEPITKRQKTEGGTELSQEINFNPSRLFQPDAGEDIEMTSNTSTPYPDNSDLILPDEDASEDWKGLSL